ncbi:hypothetical protein [Erwinia sp.]|uniref:hypothetical protein n=1 Tax=Erwinia citreus TaxID=558 RepID=UPI002896EFCD|nr:hypothetical protein [Erwinia sp.]
MTTLLKIIRWCALLAVTVLILIWLFIWLVASGSDETTRYKEDDFFNYHTLTNKDIKNAPRLTDNFYFESHPGDGYALTNSIIFKGAIGTAPLRAYLQKLGYIREKRSLGEKEIWSKPNGDLFYLYFNAAIGEVELTKVLNN